MAEMILKATGSKLQIISAIHVTSTQAQYDTCLFEFDEAWDGYGLRTAVFYSNPNNIKAMVLDVDNRCFIPWDAFSMSRYLYIGVYGSNGESYLPTQFVEVMYQPGANVDDHQYPPTPGIYEQIAEGMSDIMIAVGSKASQEALQGVVDALAGKASTADLQSLETEVGNIVSFSSKERRPTSMSYAYERSAAKYYPNLINKLQSGDLSTLKVVGVGDSHMAGQGEVYTGSPSAPELPPPPGVTDLFHKKFPGSGKFFDRFSRYFAIIYGLGMSRRVAKANEETYYHTFSGAWNRATDGRMPDDINVASSSTAGNTVIKRIDNSKGYFQRCIGIRFARVASGGIFDVHLRTANAAGVTGLARDAVWKKPSEFIGVLRSDGVTGAAMDSIDLYAAETDYTYQLYFTFPYQANWEIRLTVSANKNAESTGNNRLVGPTIIEIPHFINGGRGNHTTLDYLGHTVTVGAGGVGNQDHTNHLQEVLNLNPTIILLEAMVINDWLHGCNLQDTYTSLQEMLRRTKAKGNCDILCMTPAPVITDANPLDYAAHPSYTTMPPLVNNINSLGTYEEYIEVVRKVCMAEQVPLIDMYSYFMERFHKTDHQNWTLGADAGRIHVNQHGHNVYYEGLIQNSGLFVNNAVT